MLPGAPTPWELHHEGVLAGGCRLHVRPEGVRLAAPDPGLLGGTVAERRFQGATALYGVRLTDGTMVEVVAEPDAAGIGESVGLVPSGPGLHLFPEEAP
jgi:hypothetical protein